MFGFTGDFPLGGGYLGSPHTRLNLAAGKYMAGASAIFENTDPDPVTVTCDLVFEPPQPADSILVDAIAVGLAGAAPGALATQTASFSGPLDAQVAGSLRILCAREGPVTYDDLDVFATRVETLVNAGAP